MEWKLTLDTNSLLFKDSAAAVFPDRWHWVICFCVSTALVLAWFFKYPAEFRDFLESPLSLAPYWLLCSVASFTLVVYLERACRIEKTPAFCGLEAVVAALALGGLGLLLDARAATGPLVALLYVVAAALRRSLRIPVARWPERLGTIENIRAIFFLSGVSALLYQVIWQWRLMGFVGANSESIAVIVAVFMAGLGIGGYLGGRLAAQFADRGLALFFLIEIGIGLCGLVSLPVLDFVAGRSATVPQGPTLIGLVAALLLPPTILMGATLPVLVELMRPSVPAMNENVGKLYAINAYGSGIAALIAVLVLFPFVGQTSATVVAAVLNGAAALLVWMASRSWTSNVKVRSTSAALVSSELSGTGLRYELIAALAFLTGFITIGQEVLLIRQASWLTAGRAETFGLGVGIFLLGLASGSWRQTLIEKQNLSREASKNWLLLSCVVAATPFVAAFASALGTAAGLIVVLGTLFVCGFLGARSLPMIAGLLRTVDQHRFGTVFFANVIGSVGGSLVLGYWLADMFDLASLIILTASLTLVIGVVFHLCDRTSTRSSWRGAAGARAAIAIVLLFLAPLLSDRWLERMLLEELNPVPFSFVAHSKSGIVAVNTEGARKVVYGGGVYDGAISFRASPDLNGIGRLYRALALHDDPAQVLEIGLSSGSWARAILLDARVNSLISVEINPAYAQLVASFDDVRPILDDPRFVLVSDDGRRWMRARSDMSFDMIVSNTTYHWRSGATLITSQEFMKTVKSRLKPGGIFVINTTFSENVTATTCEAFAHCVRIGNVVAAADRPFDLSPAAARRRLSRHAQFAAMSEPSFHSWFQSWPGSAITERPTGSKIITDDAMTDEFRRR